MPFAAEHFPGHHVVGVLLHTLLGSSKAGDALIEISTGLLYRVAQQTPDLIDRVIGNAEAQLWVRWNAAASMLLLVRHGQMTRDEAVARLHEHLKSCIAQGDDEFVGMLLSELSRLSPVEVKETIDKAYATCEVDPLMAPPRMMEESFNQDEAWIREQLEHFPLPFDDAVAELRRWDELSAENESNIYVDDEDFDDDFDEDAYGEDEFAGFDNALTDNLLRNLGGDDTDLIEDDPYGEPQPIVNRHQKYGRNDPCPCGSGKKFKKCCGGKPR